MSKGGAQRAPFFYGNLIHACPSQLSSKVLRDNIGLVSFFVTSYVEDRWPNATLVVFSLRGGMHKGQQR